MARNTQTESNDTTPADTAVENAATTAATTEGTAAVVESGADERFRMVKHDVTGEMVKRTDFIKECWVQRKMTRGDIARLLSKLTGKTVVYQVVFAATKGVAGGPDKSEVAPAATEGSSTEASAG